MAVEGVPVQTPVPEVRLPQSYDEAAQEVIGALGRAGCFDGWDPAELIWPVEHAGSGPLDDERLRRRVELVDAIHRGMPALRDRRLGEAYLGFDRLAPAYYQGSRIYLQLKRQFSQAGGGTEQEFLSIYQTLLVETLAKVELEGPAAGEAVLEELKLGRPPPGSRQAGGQGAAGSAPGRPPPGPGLLRHGGRCRHRHDPS